MFDRLLLMYCISLSTRLSNNNGNSPFPLNGCTENSGILLFMHHLVAMVSNHQDALIQMGTFQCRLIGIYQGPWNQWMRLLKNTFLETIIFDWDLLFSISPSWSCSPNLPWDVCDCLVRHGDCWEETEMDWAMYI